MSFGGEGVERDLVKGFMKASILSIWNSSHGDERKEVIISPSVYDLGQSLTRLVKADPSSFGECDTDVAQKLQNS